MTTPEGQQNEGGTKEGMCLQEKQALNQCLQSKPDNGQCGTDRSERMDRATETEADSECQQDRGAERTKADLAGARFTVCPNKRMLDKQCQFSQFAKARYTLQARSRTEAAKQ